jgi:hypothetical protein
MDRAARPAIGQVGSQLSGASFRTEAGLRQAGRDTAADHVAQIKGEIEEWTRLRSRP